ncbi:hypothetical protein [Legionella steigerwaltii]|nr:hypothetical protein [Legionella steigerwaltii]
MSSFAETVKIIQSELASAKSRSNEYILFQSLEIAYLREINELIKRLNSSQEQSSKILAQIHETDRLYLNAREMEITGHILFSRHGESSLLGQKKLGLSPNACISKDAVQNMAITNRSSDALLCYSPQEHPPLIAVSPMNRAMQTASLVIPQEIKNANIEVLPFLTENSISPSGHDFRSVADMQKCYSQLSFWTSPLEKILLKLSIWIYSDRDFDLLYEKRKSAAEEIQKHGNKILSDSDKPDVCQDLNYHGDKIQDINALIDRVDQRDCWLFGHGKNFAAFFQDVFGIESDFDYGETRRVYKTKVNGTPSLYSPPYALIINQKTGKIEGKCTSVSDMSLQEKPAPFEAAAPSEGATIPNVPKVMTQLGNSVVQAQEKGTLERRTLEDSVDVEEQHTEKNHHESSPLITKGC